MNDVGGKVSPGYAAYGHDQAEALLAARKAAGAALAVRAAELESWKGATEDAPQSVTLTLLRSRGVTDSRDQVEVLHAMLVADAGVVRGDGCDRSSSFSTALTALVANKEPSLTTRGDGGGDDDDEGEAWAGRGDGMPMIHPDLLALGGALGIPAVAHARGGAVVGSAGSTGSGSAGSGSSPAASAGSLTAAEAPTRPLYPVRLLKHLPIFRASSTTHLSFR